MKRWHVITPEYGEVVPVTDWGEGPAEYVRDVIEVEAETRRDALIMGVRLMRANAYVYRWFRDWVDGNPFVGVTVEDITADYEQAMAEARAVDAVRGRDESDGPPTRD